MERQIDENRPRHSSRGAKGQIAGSGRIVGKPEVTGDFPAAGASVPVESVCSGVPLKLNGVHNAAFSSSLFLVGITLTRILFWSIRATVNITVRSPRSGTSYKHISPL